MIFIILLIMLIIQIIYVKTDRKNIKNIITKLTTIFAIILMLLIITNGIAYKYSKVYTVKELQGSYPLMLSDDGKFIVNNNGTRLKGKCKLVFLDKENFKKNGNIEMVKTYVVSKKRKPCLITKIITFSNKEEYFDSEVINYIYLDRGDR